MSIQLYDSATREVRVFKPLRAGAVSIYLCGATVQAPPHIGHVRSAINFDILHRWLTHSGYEVTFIRNVTDIDDKILQNAKKENMPWWALALKYERIFTDAYKALNVIPPTYEPRATGHITQMVELIEKLISNGKAYLSGNGDVYLDVRSLDEYLTISRQKLDDLLISPDGDQSFKKNPQDFALWKNAKEGEPSWPTPWGAGRPGWHIECSAMAHAYLGEAFDIHGGGLDLVFPHHENEIAQSNAAGYPFAKLWMHNAWVTTAGEKMSKSLGNSLRVNELLSKVRGIELRWYLGSAQYRSMLEYSPEALEESAAGFRRVENFLKRAKEIIGQMPEIKISNNFAAAMDNDLAVPEGLAIIAELVRAGNAAITADDKKTILENATHVRGALSILGCDPFDENWSTGQSNDLTEIVDGMVKIGLIEREEARNRQDWQSADRIRDAISAVGISIEDTTSGPRWTITHGEDR